MEETINFPYSMSQKDRAEEQINLTHPFLPQIPKLELLSLNFSIIYYKPNYKVIHYILMKLKKTSIKGEKNECICALLEV